MLLLINCFLKNERQDKRAQNLVRGHREIEAMRGKVMKSLEAHCNRTYIDSFPNGFPHNNHIREVTSDMMRRAKATCGRLLQESHYCALQCSFL